MTIEKTPEREEAAPSAERADSLPEVRSLDVWMRSAPIRLAGYDDDTAEPHILRGID